MKKDLVSILIVNWKQKDFIKGCIDSINESDYPKIEVIVVDNNSRDGSDKEFRKYMQKKNFIYIHNKENIGFSGGNNLALSRSSGEYILLLNVDTTFGKSAISDLVRFMKTHKKAGAVQPKLVFMSDPNKLDNVGAFLTKTGIPYYFGLYKNANDQKYNSDIRVYSCKGACMMIRRNMIEKTGFLDEYLFAYYEESDLCHRIWLAGFECWFTPSVTVNHFVGSTYNKRDNVKIVFNSHRNRIRSFLKNFEMSTLIWLVPIHLITLLGVTLVELLRGRPKIAKAILSAIFTNITNIHDTYRRRQEIQTRIRVVKDSDIADIIFRSPRLAYYRYVGGGLENYID